MIHELKILPGYFKMTMEGKKNFEVRKNDRPFQPGDYLEMDEWNSKGFTGRKALLEVTCVFCDPEYCKEGYVILGLEPCAVKADGKWKGAETYGMSRQAASNLLETLFSCLEAQKQDTDGKGEIKNE